MRRICPWLASLALMSVLAVIVGAGNLHLGAGNSPPTLLSNSDMRFAFGDEDVVKEPKTKACNAGLVISGLCQTCGNPIQPSGGNVTVCCPCASGGESGTCSAGVGADACLNLAIFTGPIANTGDCGSCSSASFTNSSTFCTTLKNATGTACIFP